MASNPGWTFKDSSPGSSYTKDSRVLVSATGSWTLLGTTGDYSFVEAKKELMSEGVAVACLSYAPVASAALLISSTGTEQPCVGTVIGDVVAEICKASNGGAFFVVPSLLNGAVFPSETAIVKLALQYCYDKSLGARAQLTAHPAVTQFLLDNARSDHQPEGLNTADVLVAKLNRQLGSNFEVNNGYLRVPKLQLGSVTAALGEHLHLLRLLAMEESLVAGADATMSARLGGTHRVNFVYASPVPIGSYGNSPENDLDHECMLEVAKAFLFAQYYGALRLAASKAEKGRRLVYLTPLGVGAFGNPPELIVAAISSAVESLAVEELERLDIKLLLADDDDGAKMRDLLQKGCQTLLFRFNENGPIPSPTLAPPGN